MKKIFIISSLCLLSILFFNIAIAKPIHIGVAWVEVSTEADVYYNGFAKALKKLAPNVTIEVKKELRSHKNLSKIIRKWEQDKQGIVLIRSKTAKWLANHQSKLPVFIGLSNNPIFLKIITNLNAPEKNITGTSYFVPVDKQLEFFKQLVPSMHSVLLLHEAWHPSSEIDWKLTEATCNKLGIKYYEADCATTGDLINAINRYRHKISAIIIGNHALGIHNTEIIVHAAGKIPVFTYLLRPVYYGALAGLSAHINKLSTQLAQSVVDVLINGKPIKEVPVKIDNNPNYYINMKTAKKLRIKIPEEILMKATLIQ